MTSAPANSAQPERKFPAPKIAKPGNVGQTKGVEQAKAEFRKSLDTKGPAKAVQKKDGSFGITASIPSSVLPNTSGTGDSEASIKPQQDANKTDDPNVPNEKAPEGRTVNRSSQPGRRAERPEQKRRLTKELRDFIHNVEVKYEIADSGKIEKKYNNFDGVFWRDGLRNYFKGQPTWPPRTLCWFFWGKGYYKDWADQRRDKYKFWVEHKEQLKDGKLVKKNEQDSSEDEETKEEKITMLRVQAARELGLKEAEGWESYESISDDGKVTKRYRRKSMLQTHPELYKSHYARKAMREERKKRYKAKKNSRQSKPKNDRDSKIIIKSPGFVGDLLSLGSKVENMDEKEIAKYLTRPSSPVVASGSVIPPKPPLTPGQPPQTQNNPNVQGKSAPPSQPQKANTTDQKKPLPPQNQNNPNVQRESLPPSQLQNANNPNTLKKSLPQSQPQDVNNPNAGQKSQKQSVTHATVRAVGTTDIKKP